MSDTTVRYSVASGLTWSKVSLMNWGIHLCNTIWDYIERCIPVIQKSTVLCIERYVPATKQLGTFKFHMVS
jgi:hypothetical protein